MLRRSLWVCVGVTVAAPSVAMGGCSSYDPATDYGAGAAGQGVTTCDQGCQDFLAALGLDSTVWFLWNQAIVGHPSGSTNVMGACPLGGSAHITGTTSVAADGTNTADLTFEFAACARSERLYELTFTGPLTMRGSFNGATEFTAVTFASPSLTTSGTVHAFGDSPVIDDTCEVTCAEERSRDSFSLSGKRCGRSFDESSLGAGGSGAGGSSQGGSSSGGSAGSCACSCPDGTDCTNATTPNPCGVDSNGIPEACGCPVGCN